MRKLFLILFLLTGAICAYAQFPYGNTGLLHLPTAEMQRHKTVLLGTSVLNSNATPEYWDYTTFNYYASITFFPFLELSYCMTLFTGDHMAEDPSYNREDFNKWANQDREFSVRIRLWKEGWWKSWTPQIVIGNNDALHTYGKKLTSTDSEGGYWGRLYIAATKHINIRRIGTLGTHLVYFNNSRSQFEFKGVGVGANLIFDSVSIPAFRKLNLMFEYDTRTFNAGLGYSLWKDRINLLCELNKLKYPSANFYWRINL